MSIQAPHHSPAAATGAALPLSDVVRICKALGHPVRMEIIALLKSEKRCFCGQIAGRLPLAQSTVSQHLKCLKDAGLIIGESEGSGIGYCLNEGLLRKFQRSLVHFLD